MSSHLDLAAQSYDSWLRAGFDHVLMVSLEEGDCRCACMRGTSRVMHGHGRRTCVRACMLRHVHGVQQARQGFAPILDHNDLEGDSR